MRGRGLRSGVSGRGAGRGRGLRGHGTMVPPEGGKRGARGRVKVQRSERDPESESSGDQPSVVMEPEAGVGDSKFVEALSGRGSGLSRENWAGLLSLSISTIFSGKADLPRVRPVILKQALISVPDSLIPILISEESETSNEFVVFFKRRQKEEIDRKTEDQAYLAQVDSLVEWFVLKRFLFDYLWQMSFKVAAVVILADILFQRCKQYAVNQDVLKISKELSTSWLATLKPPDTKNPNEGRRNSHAEGESSRKPAADTAPIGRKSSSTSSGGGKFRRKSKASPSPSLSLAPSSAPWPSPAGVIPGPSSDSDSSVEPYLDIVGVLFPLLRHLCELTLFLKSRNSNYTTTWIGKVFLEFCQRETAPSQRRPSSPELLNASGDSVRDDLKSAALTDLFLFIFVNPLVLGVISGALDALDWNWVATNFQSANKDGTSNSSSSFQKKGVEVASQCQPVSVLCTLPSAVLSYLAADYLKYLETDHCSHHAIADEALVELLASNDVIESLPVPEYPDKESEITQMSPPGSPASPMSSANPGGANSTSTVGKRRKTSAVRSPMISGRYSLQQIHAYQKRQTYIRYVNSCVEMLKERWSSELRQEGDRRKDESGDLASDAVSDGSSDAQGNRNNERVSMMILEDENDGILLMAERMSEVIISKIHRTVLLVPMELMGSVHPEELQQRLMDEAKLRFVEKGEQYTLSAFVELVISHLNQKAWADEVIQTRASKIVVSSAANIFQSFREFATTVNTETTLDEPNPEDEKELMRLIEGSRYHKSKSEERFGAKENGKIKDEKKEVRNESMDPHGEKKVGRPRKHRRPSDKQLTANVKRSESLDGPKGVEPAKESHNAHPNDPLEDNPMVDKWTRQQMSAAPMLRGYLVRDVLGWTRKAHADERLEAVFLLDRAFETIWEAKVCISQRLRAVASRGLQVTQLLEQLPSVL